MSFNFLFLTILLSQLSRVVFTASVSELLATQNIGVSLSSSHHTHYANTTSTAPSASFIASNTTSRANPSDSILTAAAQNTSGFDQGFLAASQCNDERLSYSAALASWGALVTPTTSCSLTQVPFNVTLLDTTVFVPWVTLCDGHPRTPANFTYPTVTSLATQQETVCGSPTPLHTGSYPSPSPTCTINENDCEALYETLVLSATEYTATPACTTGSAFQPNCGDCTIFANGVKLVYWPVTTAAVDICLGNGSTVTQKPSGTGPNTVVISGSTYVSPSAYLSFSDIFATVSNGALCGNPVSNIDIPIATFDLTSISYSGIPPEYTSAELYYQSMNLANLNWPVPWSAYRGMFWDTTPDFTMSRPYLPQIVLPSWLSGLQEPWRTCSVDSTGVYDPPSALTTVQSIAPASLTTFGGSSTTSDSISTISASATPGNPVQPSLASATSSLLGATGSVAAVGASQSSDPNVAAPSVANAASSGVASEPSVTTQASSLFSPSPGGTTAPQNAASIPSEPSLSDPASSDPSLNDSSSSNLPLTVSYTSQSSSEDPSSDQQSESAQSTNIFVSSDSSIANLASYIAQAIRQTRTSTTDSGQPSIASAAGDTAPGPSNAASSDPGTSIGYTGSSETSSAPIVSSSQFADPVASTGSEDLSGLLAALQGLGPSSTTASGTAVSENSAIAVDTTFRQALGSSTAAGFDFTSPISIDHPSDATIVATDSGVRSSIATVHSLSSSLAASIGVSVDGGYLTATETGSESDPQVGSSVWSGDAFSTTSYSQGATSQDASSSSRPASGSGLNQGLTQEATVTAASRTGSEQLTTATGQSTQSLPEVTQARTSQGRGHTTSNSAQVWRRPCGLREMSLCVVMCIIIIAF